MSRSVLIRGRCKSQCIDARAVQVAVHRLDAIDHAAFPMATPVVTYATPVCLLLWCVLYEFSRV